jgi:SAM-dependent methyltransferase
MDAEQRAYQNVTEVHDLPQIYHYWSNKFLRPMVEEFGFSHPDHLFVNGIVESAKNCTDMPPQIFSIGSGNCDTEVRIAKQLIQHGLGEFSIECLDVNPQMLQRGRANAMKENVEGHFIFTEGDFNTWSARRQYAAIIANHSLHHVVNLEGLFEEVKRGLGGSGYFIINDMIGRNGHQRWPEALVEVQRFWNELPREYRYNHQLRRHHETFQDWDCSIEGFEGIRAQDILPLLVDRFDFKFFLAFANVIDIFIDRSFGPNFSVDREWDRAFIDRVHEFDEQAILSRRLTPTHMLAVMTPGPCQQRVYARRLSPRDCIRQVDL